MATIYDYARLSWSIKRLRSMDKNPCYNLDAICRAANIDYYKIRAFLDITNDILDNKLDLAGVLKQYEIQERELIELGATFS